MELDFTKGNKFFKSDLNKSNYLENDIQIQVHVHQSSTQKIQPKL